MKVLIRLFDLIVAAVFLVLAAPILIAVAILIKLDSPGPLFFMQERVGKNWRRFKMFKFRKMFDEPRSWRGPAVTARFDSRVTRVGSWLERTKLDELPQFLNVLIGDMSLVGPRPEVPRFTGEPYRELWDKVLTVKPGIFGLNQITHRNEAEMYPEDCGDLEQYFVEHILSAKLQVDAKYVDDKSFLYDLRILACGVWASLAGVITPDTIRTRRWQVAYLAGCVLLGEITLTAAFFLRYNWNIPADRVHHLFYGLLVMGLARLITFVQLRVHRSVHVYFTLSDALRICASVTIGTVLGIAMQILFDFRPLSRSIFIVDGVLLIASLIVLNFLADRALALLKRNRSDLLFSWSAYVLWSVVAGVAGVVSMLYALAVVWPGVFLDRWFELTNILVAAFLVRLVLLPFLLRRLPRRHDFVSTVTQQTRSIAAHLALVFIADITGAFFLNIRAYSRSAVIVNAVFYSFLLVFVLAVRCAWNRKYRCVTPEGSRGAEEGKRVLVVGDGRETGFVVSAIRLTAEGSLEPVGVVTANPHNRTRHVEGVEVVGTTNDMSVLLETTQPSTVIVLNHTIHSSALRGVVRACRRAGVDIRFVPSLMQFVAGPGKNGKRSEPAAPAPKLGSSRARQG